MPFVRLCHRIWDQEIAAAKMMAMGHALCRVGHGG